MHIVRQVCDSLEEAHYRGLVHRDIKPANIHIGRRGLRYDFVKVLDFGLVKSVGADAAGSSQATMETAAGMVAGTPAFMAPEVALGEAYDGRSDLYALGCVAYFLLTARLPFEGVTPINVIAKHVHAAPVPPSERIGSALPPALERAVLRCLSKRPEERPASAGELARMLDALHEHRWSEDHARDWWSRRAPAGVH